MASSERMALEGSHPEPGWEQIRAASLESGIIFFARRTAFQAFQEHERRTARSRSFHVTHAATPMCPRGMQQ